MAFTLEELQADEERFAERRRKAREQGACLLARNFAVMAEAERDDISEVFDDEDEE